MFRRTHFLFVPFIVLASVLISVFIFSCRQEAESSSLSFSLSSEAVEKIFDGGGRSNSKASRALTGGSEYTLEISVYGEDISVSRSYTIKEPETENGGKNTQVFTIDDLPSEISVSVNVSVFRDGNPLWKTKDIPTILLYPGDNFIDIEMVKAGTPDNPDNPDPENPSITDAEYTVKHLVQKLSEDKSSVLNEYIARETERLSGKIGEETSASLKEYEGFTAQSFEQKTVNADGSTVVEIRYNRNSYKVVFDSNGGSGAVPDIETFYGAEFQIPENTFTAAAGYKASANIWKTRKDGSGVTYKAGEKASSLASENGATVTLFADWIEKSAHSITYYDSDGSVISGMSKTSFKENESVDLSAVRAEKQGYTFSGWSFTQGGSDTTEGWNAGEKTEDVSLHAIWTANTDTKYTVKHIFENVDGTYAENTGKTQSLTGTTGGTTNASALSGSDITGFTAQSFEQKTVNADGSTVVEIKYERKTVTLTFNLENGSASPETVSGKYGASVSAPQNPTKTGYTFSGWSSEVPATFPAENQTYTAAYNANTYTIEFSNNGGSGNVASIPATYGTEVSLPDNTFTAPGGKQKSESNVWNRQSDGNGTGYKAGDKVLNLTSENNGTVTLYAVWEDIPAPAVPAGFVKIDGGTVNTSIGTTGPFKSASTTAVKVDAFYIAEAELTYQKWKEVYDWATTGAGKDKGYVFANLGREGSSGTDGADVSDGQQPVTFISWRDAVVWCNAASEMENLTPVYMDYDDKTGNTPVRRAEKGTNTSGNETNTENSYKVAAGDGKAENATVNSKANGYRLPTEAEWEFAARGGNPSANEWSYKYAGTNIETSLSSYAVYNTSQTSRVKTKIPNSANLYDMCGNVFEWCYEPESTSSSRVQRGGSWKNQESKNLEFLDAGNRSFQNLASTFNTTSNQYGFRLARSVIE